MFWAPILSGCITTEARKGDIVLRKWILFVPCECKSFLILFSNWNEKECIPQTSGGIPYPWSVINHFLQGYHVWPSYRSQGYDFVKCAIVFNLQNLSAFCRDYAGKLHGTTAPAIFKCLMGRLILHSPRMWLFLIYCLGWDGGQFQSFSLFLPAMMTLPHNLRI